MTIFAHRPRRPADRPMIPEHRTFPRHRTAALAAAALLAAGCTQMAPIRSTTPPPAQPGDAAAKTAGSQNKAVPSQFSDLPIPNGAKVNVDKTLVVGTQTWYGQLSLDTGHNADAMFEFYSRELANYGWRRIAAVRAPTSILTYDRDERVLAIAITPSRVYGSEITITVSPREEAMPAMPGRPAPAPAGPTVGPGAGEPLMPPPVRQVK